MKPPERHPLICLFVYVATVLVLGAVLAPLLFQLGHRAADALESFRLRETPPFGYLHKVAIESGFERYFNRAVLIAALVCLWPLARRLGLRRADFLPGRRDRMAADLAVGFVLAAGLLLLLGWGLVRTGAYSFRDEIDWADSLRQAAVTGAGVALLEEFFFRGALLALLLRAMRPGPALIGLSVFFAAVHFLKPPESMEFSPDSVNSTSGFILLGAMLRNFGNVELLAAEFATLLAVALVLGWTRLRTGALWLPIGLHGGWVFGVILFRGIARGTRDTRAGEALPWIGDNLKTGLAPLAVVGLTALILALWLRATGARSGTSGSP